MRQSVTGSLVERVTDRYVGARFGSRALDAAELRALERQSSYRASRHYGGRFRESTGEFQRFRVKIIAGGAHSPLSSGRRSLADSRRSRRAVPAAVRTLERAIRELRKSAGVVADGVLQPGAGRAKLLSSRSS